MPIYRISKKDIRLAGCGIKSMRPIFKTEMFSYQSKADLGENFFGKSLIFKIQKLEKCLKGAYIATRIPPSILVHDLIAIEINTLFLQMTIALNSNFGTK